MTATALQASKTALPQEDLHAQLETLRTDLATLAATVSGDLSDGLEKTGRQISRTSRDARDAATGAVLDHPLAAIGIAAGLELFLGLVTRRG